MNDLSQYEQPHDIIFNMDDSGYASADDAVHNNSRAGCKCIGWINLFQYVQSHKNIIIKDDVVAAAPGYASADDAVYNNSRASRKCRGVPWTGEEHRLFLLGLQKQGKGDWRGISRNFVVTRTPTQVASYAQKYFLRQSVMNHRRRRSSLFDIVVDGNDGDDGDDRDNNGGGGDKNKKKGGGHDGGEGNGDGGDKAEGGDGKEKGMNKDCTGQLGFGYRCTYHAGYENGYLVEQLNALKMFCSENIIK